MGVYSPEDSGSGGKPNCSSNFFLKFLSLTNLLHKSSY